MQALGVLFLVVGIIVSVRERKYMMMWRSQSTSNHLANALSQLVGTAGGIYLSLELLFSFLKIPENWWSESIFFVEPLAAISLLLAILQPFGLKAWLRLRK
ncbi:putative membrane protein [Candidatus Desulfosporosinus infrequens]|uniref:Putative membrane protein n=1 Tax=Candidatus Desulfosporosinus infrequens TaxID=2043169 RepID=A0A2U3LTQ1_9FIRM|nr:putative membrane protein [Candidatus Desulfosporosinus infrequens]